MSVHAVTSWYFRSGLDSFWLRLSAKAAVAAFVLCALRVLSSQDVAAPPAPASGIPEAVDGRGYKVWQPVESLVKNQIRANQFKNDMKKVLKGEIPLAEKKSEFEAFYTRFQFPMWTQTGEKELKNLAEERNAFFRDLENAKADAHDELVRITLTSFPTVVRDDKFHPAVRYNAMMMIGSLNDREPVRAAAGGGAGPVPTARALKLILDEFKRPENPDSVRMAALLGLARHLEWDNEKQAGIPQIPADIKKEITTELLTLAQATEAPAGHSAEGHTWFRRRAVEALGFVSLRKADAEIATALEALVKDETQPLALRCTAAATLGRIVLPADVNPTAIAKELGYLALAACDAELTRVTSLKKDEEEHLIRLQGQVPDPNAGQAVPLGPRAGLQAGAAGGMMPGSSGMPGGGYMPMPGGGSPDSGGYGMGTMDPSLGDPKAYRFDHSRRRIRQQLYCVQLGLTGGEDRQEKKAASTPITTTATAAAASAPKAEQRGLYAMTKPGPDKDQIGDIYLKVRKLAEVVEARAIDIPMLDKELRKEFKNVEASIGRQFIPPPDAKKLLEEEPVVTPPPADAKKPAKGPVKGKKVAPPKKPAAKVPMKATGS